MNLIGLRFRAPASWSAAVLCRFPTDLVSATSKAPEDWRSPRPGGIPSRLGDREASFPWPSDNVTSHGGATPKHVSHQLQSFVHDQLEFYGTELRGQII